MTEEPFVLIPLANGKGFVKVSPEDRELALKYKWHLSCGYANATIVMHRHILNLSTFDEWIDHINGDPLDNRRSNLRIASRAQNNMNKRKLKKGTSKFRGVKRDSKWQVWYASIGINNKALNLGRYINEEDAARAYDSAALYYFKEFALTNFPDMQPLSAEKIRSNARKNYSYSSKYKGVSRRVPSRKNKIMWQAHVYLGNRKTEYIGSFDSEEAAARAYDEAAKKLYGAKAKLNFPTGD